MAESSLIENLGRVVLEDLLLGPSCGTDAPELEAAYRDLQAATSTRRIVYTAYDGDHWMLSPHMRWYVVSHGLVPANPESILGYKETVTARLTKRGVLLDDLGVLRACDELWVFTEHPPEPSSLANLAEGIVTEVLFYLRRRPQSPIRFVNPIGLLHGIDVKPEEFPFTYEEAREWLHPDQRAIIDLVNGGSDIDRDLPQIVFFITDPLDSKYSHWLRPKAYEEDHAPLVPGLALPIDDFSYGIDGLGTALVGWTKLMELASRAWIMPSLGRSHGRSLTVDLLERYWLRTYSAGSLLRRRWDEFPIPKARQGNRWPLTRLEGGLG